MKSVACFDRFKVFIGALRLQCEFTHGRHRKLVTAARERTCTERVSGVDRVKALKAEPK